MTARAQYEAEVARVWAGQADGAHDLAHLSRVWQMAKRIAQDWGACDLAVIEAASYLHDIVNPPKDSPKREQAAALSAAHAADFLRGLGWAEEAIKNVCHAIEAHSFSAGVTPRTREAQVVQDADRLEALGALGIARCFNVSGQMGAALFAPDDPLAEHRDLNDRRYALDHFEVKLLRIAETMHSPLGQRLARERAAFMRLFREQLIAEISAAR